MKSKFFFLLFFSTLMIPAYGQTKKHQPLRIGVVGLVHTHVHWILGREKIGDIEIVGIAEPNRELAQRYAEQHGYSMDIVFNSTEEMLEKTKPDAVTDFSTIFNHLNTVKLCAPKGIHVMVEKPLAVNLAHAKKMEELANKHNIYLLTNYETTWYGSNHEAKKLINAEKNFGDIRKIVVHDGHPGPIEIGCNEEFLEWLTDPYFNGAGALTDFGCYGANLTTWLMNGERPLTVTAITQQIKPDLYPKVDDEATIILTYPKSQSIIQASWNWNYNRKDMEVYCKNGYVHCLNGSDMEIMRSEKEGSTPQKAKDLVYPYNDPFAYMAGILNGTTTINETDLSALENNMTVMEILEAAKISAKEMRTVKLSEIVD
ncbi:MAG: Gfo/Idh/MocA family oxidoreductase [Bacteroidota bacterium]